LILQSGAKRTEMPSGLAEVAQNEPKFILHPG
jgi:hypothetical protein